MSSPEIPSFYLPQSLPITTSYQKVERESSSSGATSAKTNEVSLNALNIKFLAKGAIKVVWEVLRNQFSPTQIDLDKSVYYTPVESFLNWNERELKEEVEKMGDINKRLSQMGKGSTDHLAVDAEVVPEEEKIKGQLTIKTSKASGDFEKMLRNPATTMEERIHLGGHVLEGLKSLHQAGYVHGDLKPENCLIFKKIKTIFLKISDFGKAKLLKAREMLSYSGNTRFAPPEGLLSQKSDVYGAAMILIRNFEEPFLENGGSLFEFDPKYKDMTASEDLRGVEKYVVEHNSFLATNSGSKTSLWTRLVRRFAMGRRPIEEQINQKIAMDNYIDVLENKLKGDPLLKYRAESLCDLLREMTALLPERISAEEAHRKYQEIMSRPNPA